MNNNTVKNREDLARLFNELNFKVGAEIGVLQGIYSRFLCQLNNALKLYCIDSWGIGDRNKQMESYHIKMYEVAKRKLSPYNTVIIRKPSKEAVNYFEDESLDFVYIDADHHYESVVEDINLWNKKVKTSGIVSGHDYDFDSVKKAVDEHVKTFNYSLNLTELGKDKNQSWWFIKK